VIFVSTKGALNQNLGFNVPFAFFLPHFLISCFLGLSVFIASAAAMDVEISAEETLAEISALVSEGAPGLSLMLLEQSQPLLEQDPEGWGQWQKQRLTIFQQQGQWSEIVRSYESLPEYYVPVSYRNWLQDQTIDAYLAIGDGEAARDLLLPLVWGVEENSDQLKMWRRQVVMSYLAEGRNSDAYIAMLRYEQDYSNVTDEADWIAVKSRVMINSGRVDEAAVLSVASEDVHGHAIYVLAKLKQLAPLTESLLSDVVAQVNNPVLDQGLRQEIYITAFEKANLITAWPERILALEQLLETPEVGGAQVATVVDALWYAYNEYGSEMANRMQLLMGDFESWFESIERLSQSSPLQARSMLAAIALQAESAEDKVRAHEQLVAGILQNKNTATLLKPLYLSSSQFTDVSTLPMAVMYRLLDKALEKGDSGLASKLMSQLDVPSGVDLVEWQLRRARVQILAGASESGTELLMQMITDNSLSRPQMDYLIQIIMDLQNIDAHDQAFQLLSVLLTRVPELSMHREMLFWMADSRMAQKRFAEAAKLYLHSAVLIKPGAMDEWAQRSRYHAAQALEKAGLNEDAIKLYQTLLDVTESEEQRLVIRRRIQSLLLRAQRKG
jgi:tetratricopeptide (TPR) repeat protein